MTIIDPTETPLKPSDQGKDCLGNGNHPEYECCCDECDYFLCCFPQYDQRHDCNKDIVLGQEWLYNCTTEKGQVLKGQV